LDDAALVVIGRLEALEPAADSEGFSSTRATLEVASVLKGSESQDKLSVDLLVGAGNRGDGVFGLKPGDQGVWILALSATGSFALRQLSDFLTVDQIHLVEALLHRR
jgi:hypothetical protein